MHSVVVPMVLPANVHGYHRGMVDGQGTIYFVFIHNPFGSFFPFRSFLVT